MKTLLPLVGAAFGLALFGGCKSPSTVSTRLQEKSAITAQLSSTDQKKLEDGVVEVGYTADMVYVALGRPTKVSVTNDGRVGIWTYDHYLPSEAVAQRPFYAASGGYKGRPAFRSGGSAGSAHDGGAMGPINRGYVQGDPQGFGWASPDIIPITLHIKFTAGRVSGFAVNDGA